MKFLIAFILLIPVSLLFDACSGFKTNPVNPKKGPSDWFIMQRSFPYGKVDYDAYQNAVQKKKAMVDPSGLRDYLVWTSTGPVNIGGRVQDIEMDPSNPDIIYVGSASGGIFKTTNAGATWTPVFDEMPSLSIGDLAVSPSNPSLLFAGTGEPNCGGGSITYDGRGVFKSTDAGTSWSSVGLDSTRNTGRIVIDPKNENRVFAATMGDLFADGPHRGVYRTTDGGTSWKKVLHVNDSTGAIDLAIHPKNPDTIYACTWERVRRFTYRNYGGDGCGIYRSYDGGDTWTELTSGLPSTDNGRIGIDISVSDPEVLYAIYADETGYFKGVYKTTDGGDNWSGVNDNALSGMFASYGWWFGRIEVDPNDPEVVFAIGFDMYRSTNGGSNWSYVSGSMHVDHHTVFIHPANSDLILCGNDGGVYQSTNGGSSWTHFDNLPNNQFYTSEIDYSFPYRLYGGTQDNGVLRTVTGNTDDWEEIIYGDGFYILVDPTDNNFQYGESQYGALVRSVNGGLSFTDATNGISASARKNWNCPIAFNPQNPGSLYFGTNKLYKSVNQAKKWTAISDDLSNGYVNSNVTYGTIVTVAVSPVDTNIILAGTDDGNVWVTQNNGTDWVKVSDELPDRWVTRVVCDPLNQNIAYVTLSGYKYSDALAHVYRTTDLGVSWEDIGGNLPDIPVNDLIIDPVLDSTLYIASDIGVFYTTDLGEEWLVLGEGLPLVPVTDLTFHNDTRLLAAATYGRSIYTMDLSVFTQVADPVSLESGLRVIPGIVGDLFVVSFDAGIFESSELKIYDSQGRLIWSSPRGQRWKGQVEFLLSRKALRLDPGYYFATVAHSQGCVVSKFLVQ